VTASASILAALALTSGVQGVVTRGPVRPVCAPAAPCTAPAPGERIVFTRGTHRYAVTTDARGRYRIVLPPGTYRVRLARLRLVGVGLEPAVVVVPRGRFATRNFSYDTGIR